MNHYSPGRSMRLLSSVSRPAIDSIRLPMQWVPEALYPRGKTVGVWKWSLISIWCLGYECVQFSKRTNLVVINAMPQLLYPSERPNIHSAGGWVDLRASLDWCRKFCPTTIWSPDRPACSKWSVLEYLIRRLGKSMLTHIRVLACNGLSLSYPFNSHHVVSV